MIDSHLLTTTRSDPPVVQPLHVEYSPVECAIRAAVAEATHHPIDTILLDELPGGTAHRVWRITLADANPWSVQSFVAKLLPATDPEASVLYWLPQKGSFAPRLYDAIPIAPSQQLLLIEDLGECALPTNWIDRPRLVEGVVAWLSDLTRVALPDPLVPIWADWASPHYAVHQFEQAWHQIAARLAKTPGWVGPLDVVALRATFSRRASLSQRLRSVCRRLCHGDLAPHHIRLVTDRLGGVAVRAVDWGQVGRGALAFDIFDLLGHLPEAHFDLAFERLFYSLPADVRPELTPPVLRLAGEIKAFLAVGALARQWLARPDDGEARTALATALCHLHRWQQ